MKKIFFIIISIIIILLLGFVILISSSNEINWHNGKLRQDIYVMYSDESYESIINTGDIFNLYYNEQEIILIQYKLSGMQNSENNIVDLTGYNVIFNIYDENNIKIKTFHIGSNTSSISVGSEWKTLYIYQFTPDNLISYTDKSGRFQIEMTPQGNIKINDGTGWKNTDIPDHVSFELFSDGEGKINLELVTGT